MKTRNNGSEPKLGFIFDIDGVVVDSPHEEAWGSIAKKYGIKQFTSEDYLATAAGRPREAGARKIFEKFGLDTGKNDEILHRFCKEKQALVSDLIRRKKFKVFKVSVIFMLKAKKKGALLAAASSSKNAKPMLEMINMNNFIKKHDLTYKFIKPDTTLYDLFDVDVCGRDIKPGKPHPKIFLVAADELGIPYKNCVVFEDAISGVEAAKNAGMFCVGIRRIGKKQDLINAGADMVVDDLSELTCGALKKKVSKLG